MLSVSRLVNVQVNLSPLAAQGRNFGVLNIAGDSNVISGLERIRYYVSLEGVALDFGINAPEYLAAQLYFGQNPQPLELAISRWLRTATAGELIGGILTLSQQAIANFTAVTSGGMSLPIDGATVNLTALNFSGAANLNAVAAIVTTGLSTHGSCLWNGSQFEIISATTGNASSVGFAVAPGSGTDISTLFKMTSGLAQPLIPGYAAESAAACVTALATKTPNWYGIMFAASTMPSDSDNLAIAAEVEAFSISRMFGVTITNTNVLDSTTSADLASELKAGEYEQTFPQYSENPYAVASMFGRAFSVDFTGNNTTITLMYKQEPSVVPEDLTEQQAETLENKRCNVFVSYDNDTAIIEDGVMSGPAFFDEIHGLDWFQNAIQTACYNLLYTSPTKIPQTDAGVAQIANVCSGVCDQAVNNGLVAAGVWNAPGFGNLTQGQYLKTGYYVFAQSVALQSQSDREARKAPPIQIAIKLAGAIQTMDVLVNVNR